MIALDPATALPPEMPDPPQATWIRKTPAVVGGDACIRNTRISVWGLVAWRKLGLTDAQIREHVPDVSPADLRVAWAYYRLNTEEIDQAIAENTGDA